MPGRRVMLPVVALPAMPAQVAVKPSFGCAEAAASICLDGGLRVSAGDWLASMPRQRTIWS